MAEQGVAVGLVSRLVERASGQGLALCHWKSNIRLPLSVIGRTDLDLSIPPAQEPLLHKILLDLGFLPFRTPAWAYYVGVSDWLGLDSDSGTLLHVHLHTRLLTGAKSVKEQDLPWLDLMNTSLRQDAQTAVPIPAAAFEYHLLYTREAIKSRSLRGFLMRLRGRPSLDVATVEELQWLWGLVEPDEIDVWGERLWGHERWLNIRSSAQYPQICHDEDFCLLAKAVGTMLAPWRKGNAVSNSMRFLGMRFWQMAAERWEQTFLGTRPKKRLLSQRGPIIAFVGSDGAGKSTVTSDTERWLGWKADVAVLYFGSNHGWYRHLRILRALFKSRSSRCPNTPPTHRRVDHPAWLLALLGVFLARKRLRQQRRAIRMAQRGTIVLADRWPQFEVCGLCDGPALPVGKPGGWLVGMLQRYERRLFQRMAMLSPDLVIKLNVPLEVAMQRKLDHSPEMLARKIEIVRELSFAGAPMIEVDAAQPLNEVNRIVRVHLWEALRRVWKAGYAVY